MATVLLRTHLSRAARRAALPPPPLVAELARPRLVELLARRWDLPVITVVAGPGFGKSTALAQALRHNHSRARGLDAWISCEPGDEDAGRLREVILDALGLPAGRGASELGEADAIVAALRSTSPVPVCLVLDDVHELVARSSALEMLGEVVRRLPAHAHLLLASRRPIPLPLTRLRAASRVLDITQEALAFCPDEIEVLAASAGARRPSLEPFGGWPALVRLALAAPPGAPASFVWEEVVDRLAPRDRRALLALATLGTADASSLSELCDDAVDVDALVASVPLVTHTGDGQVRAHDLWRGTLSTVLPDHEVAAMTGAALRQLLDDGAHVRAGALAARVGNGEALCAAALALVHSTISVLPVDTAAAWLRAAPFGYRDRPELVLLDAALRHARCGHDPDVASLLDRAWHGFVAGGDRPDRDGVRSDSVDGDAWRQAVLGIRLVLAHTHGDVGMAIEVAEAARHLRAGSTTSAALQVLAPVAAATEAHLRGEVDAAASALDDVVLTGVPAVVAEAVLRLRWHTLVLAGRAADAIPLAARGLARASTPNAALFEPVARWSAGDPSGFDGVQRPVLSLDERTGADAPYPRDWFNHGLFVAVVWASAGDRDIVAQGLRLMRAVTIDTTASRNAAPLAVVRAALHLVDHDEAAAEQAIAAYLAEHPLTDRLGEVSLRRFLAIPYVCSAEARRRWDAQALGPAHQGQREVARALLRARAGRLRAGDPLPPPATVYTAVPLPWTVELAVRAHAAHHPGGERLLQWLVDRLGRAPAVELAHLATSVERSVARAAHRLLASVPSPPERTTDVVVLGPFQLLVDGVVVARPEQRRVRVRELLAVLVICGRVGRERAMDLLWPDLTPADAARNLRVTLTHLRRLLEPERDRGGQCYHVRDDADHLRLVESERLRVDLWDVRRDLASAATARASGDVTAQTHHLERVVARWTGTPLTDLDRVSALDSEVASLRVELLDATLTLGELRLSEGDATGTLACAERALGVDEYCERAYRLLVAAHVQRGDRVAASSAVTRTLAALDDLGVTPDPQTAIVLRQAH